MFGIVAVDTAQFGKAVVRSPFAVGLNHIAQGKGRRHGVAVQVEVDASRLILDIDIASVDEGHHTLHQSVFVEGKGTCLSNGDEGRAWGY